MSRDFTLEELKMLSKWNQDLLELKYGVQSKVFDIVSNKSKHNKSRKLRFQAKKKNK